MEDPDKALSREPDDKEPLSALAFKIASDPFLGTLTFVRIYSGQLEAGTFAWNANKGKKERIGRMMLMHANSREDVKVRSILQGKGNKCGHRLHITVTASGGASAC